MNRPAYYLLFTLMLHCWALVGYAQPTPEQWAQAEELVERYCTLSARLAAKGQDDPGAFGALSSHVFANSVNNPVYNDLLPGETETNAAQYLSMLRMQQGTLRFDYGAPEWYHALVVGQLILLAKVPKTITDGFGRTREVTNVLVINVNPTTDEVGKLTEIGSRMLENASRRGDDAAPANRATLTPNRRPESTAGENSSNASLKNGTILTDVAWLEMVYVEGGSFRMGSDNGQEDEKPVHPVEVSGFYMGKTEVTQAQWRRVMGSDPPVLRFKGCDQCPVERVSWNDIQEFLQKLNRMTGQTYRLPREAEWEYAARGGNQSRGYTYAGSNDLDEVAWYDKNSDDLGRDHPNYGTNPVAQKKPNELGLYDMTGNVWEWCADWYGSDYYASSPRKDPQGPATGSYRVVRGGSWFFAENLSRVASRFRNFPDSRLFDLGFRLCRDL